MKLLQSSLLRSSFFRGLLLLGAAYGSLAATQAFAAASDDAFTINIRTNVPREYTLFSKKPAVVHSKLYALAWIKQAKSDVALSNPVDEAALLQQLHDVLAAHGFHEPEAGKAPDIVITVLYGRSKLKNPYADPGIAIDGEVSGGQGAGSGGGIGIGNYGNDAINAGGIGNGEVSGGIDMIISDRTPGEKTKRLLAENEKAFIGLTAWEYPGFIPTPKPKQLWRTVVNVDDPTLDLNLVGGKMLAVAAPYFDREIKDKEISLSSALADAAAPKQSLSHLNADKSTK